MRFQRRGGRERLLPGWKRARADEQPSARWHAPKSACARGRSCSTNACYSSVTEISETAGIGFPTIRQSSELEGDAFSLCVRDLSQMRTRDGACILAETVLDEAAISHRVQMLTNARLAGCLDL
jgi:hypothetical protein